MPSASSTRPVRGAVTGRSSGATRAPAGSREGGGEPVGGEQALFGCEQVAGGGECELVAVEPVAAGERECEPGGGDDSGGGERDRGGREAEELVDAVAGGRLLRRGSASCCR